jgi:hypothetical protein
MIRPAANDTTAIPLTEARTRLFRLVEDLLAGRMDRVALSLRGNDEEVLLVRARDLERMEQELAVLRQRAAPEPRPLRGLGRIADGVNLEQFIAATRADQQELTDARLRDIAAVHERRRPPKRGGRGRWKGESGSA